MLEAYADEIQAETTGTTQWQAFALADENGHDELIRSLVSFGDNVIYLDKYRQQSFNAHQQVQSHVAEIDAARAGGQSTTIPAAIRANWFLLRQSHLSDKVFSQIVDEAITSMRPLSEVALSTFITLWECLRPGYAQPVIGISPTGDIVAEWFSDPDNSLVLMTDQDSNIHFSLFDQGAPTEGFEKVDRAATLIARLTAGQRDPFLWTDA